MSNTKIDINADLGEGFLFDEELMKLVSSCNIACGGHAGTVNSMRATVWLAKKHGVTIGAHPSYPDPENFGRKEMDIAPEMLKNTLKTQIYQLINIAREEGTVVRYVKPHGALYNKVATDVELAELLVDVVKEIEPSVGIMGLANSVLEDVAKKNYLFFIRESFADRRYHATGTLVARSNPKGVIHNKTEVWEQVKNMVLAAKVVSIEQQNLGMNIDSVCFHGDTPEALELLTYVYKQLKENKITIQNAI